MQHWPGRFVVYDPSARVSHNVPASRSRWRYFVSRCYAEGRSKAAVARLVGSHDGLSSELRYSTRVLPAGLARGLRDAFVRGDAGGLGRAAAIVLGLAVTTVGFVAGRFEGARGTAR